MNGEKILVTGATGRLAFPVCQELAKSNDVFALARFRDSSMRAKLETAGVKTIEKDLADSDLSNVPEDFTHVFHAGAVLNIESEVDQARALEVNCQATGRLMYHCLGVKGFTFCSSAGVHAYPGHIPLKETDPYGLYIHNYSLSKIAAEAVVIFASRQWNIPTTILRIYTRYGPSESTVARQLDLLVQGKDIPLNPDKPNYTNPIYETDWIELVIKSLSIGRMPPHIINIAGSDITTKEDYLAYMGELLGLKPNIVYSPSVLPALLAHTTYMEQVLGKPKVGWREGMMRTVRGRYPQLC